MTVKIDSEQVYLDTSALAKLYVPEPESDELEAALLNRTDLIVSDLAVTEMASALARRARQHELSVKQAGWLYRELLRDLSLNQFRHVHLGADVHREAERLLSTIGHQVALRAADALHLATANLSGAQVLVTYDAHLRDATSVLGTIQVMP
jgi:predicted nucleic acid-binding protein